MARKNVVICGAGIAGISTAYQLAVNCGVDNVVLVDDRPPLSLTSDKSTECYRNWWPGPGNAMVSLMNRSIDLLEKLAISHNNTFHLNRRGYLYLTADDESIPDLFNNASESSQLGGGPLRIYRGDTNDPSYHPAEEYGFNNSHTGADLILDQQLLNDQFPYITDKAVAALHVRRAGWFSAQQLGNLLLELAKEHGVILIQDRVEGIELEFGRINSIKLASGDAIPTSNFVIAAGPFLPIVAEMIGVELPVFSELHLKVSIKDHLGIVPRNAPMLIWNDAQYIPWSQEERQFLIKDKNSRWLLKEFPAGVHTRPEGPVDSPIILMLWEYQEKIIDPIWPPSLDPDYPEIVLRGLTTMIPGLSSYFDKPPKPFLDGGYYTKTKENRPIIGGLPVEGAWVIGALSGFGLMASMAASELLALHVLGKPLPEYAPAFELKRYTDPAYLKLLDNWENTGQL